MKNIFKKEHSNLLVIGGIVIAVLLIITVIIISLLGNGKNKHRTYESVSPGAEIDELALDDTMQLTAIFLEADTGSKEITVSDVATGEKLSFDYSGGTQITDKYDQLIIISQLERGQVVKLNYAKDTTKLVKLSVSGDIWENIGITDIKINKEAKIISYLGKNYSYSDGTVVLSGEEVIDMDELLPLDYLTIRGNEENIYSIVVTNGHGYLEFEGEEKFLGGTINVGTQLTQEVTLNMRLIVKEGTHVVTLNNQDKEGSKEIEIKRDLTTTCNMTEFGIEPVVNGEVKFVITPESANLLVDEEKVPFKAPISLRVGEHEIEVSLGGYVSYRGTILVDPLGTTVTITLHENEAATTEDTNTDGDTTTEDTTNEGTGSTSNNSGDNSSDNNTGSDNNSGNQDNSDSDGQTNNSTDDTNQNADNTADDTITINWTTGAEVYFNEEFIGVIEDGVLVTDKIIGDILIELVIEGEDPVQYNVTVEDDGKDVVFSFPE